MSQARLIEEESLPDYSPDDFYPVKVGDVYNNKYRIVAKLGYGATSTVWLAKTEDWWNRTLDYKYVAVKIGRSNESMRHVIENELRISQRLNSDPNHRGYKCVATLLDTFEMPGENAEKKHLCLVTEPGRSCVSSMLANLPDGKMKPFMTKFVVRCVLESLEYLHEVCNVIYTDLTLDNIFLAYDGPAAIDTIKLVESMGMPDKVTDEGRLIYRSVVNLGKFRMLPVLGDYNVSYPREWPDHLRRLPIQHQPYTAPEVIMGTIWDHKVDIWSVGCMLWTLLEGRDLFEIRREPSPEENYEPGRQLASMQAILGPAPRVLIEKSLRESRIDWREEPQLNWEGKLAKNPAEYFGGPFFSEDGEFLHQGYETPNTSLADTVTALEGKEKELFLDFAGQMLRWLPEERKSATELLKHPWLDSE